MISELGPCQPLADELFGYQFPNNINGRHFNEQWYFRVLPDGKKIVRDWLSYSPKLNKAFCLPCILFGSDKNISSRMSWAVNGYDCWQNGRNNISAHELTTSHINSSVVLKIQKTTLPILPSLEYGRRLEIATNQKIVSELINIVIFLAQHNIAFRGNKENWSSNIKGNFKDLVILMASLSPILSSHLSLVKSKGKKATSFITWERQNQLIDCISQSIKCTINKGISEASFFSISIDSTFDASRTEQISFIARYVNSTGDIFERLLALKSSAITTGEVLFNIFKSVMEENNLQWKTALVGQSYDGAGNMSGEHKGLQSRIKLENDHALFIWCHAHRLNLVVTSIISKGKDGIDMFGNLESLYAFLWTSKKRVDIFRQKQYKLYPKKQLQSVKRVATTRWMSHSVALKTIISKFEALIQTLEEIIEKEGPSDVKAAATANGLIRYFLSFRFILTAFCFKILFDILDPLNKAFQESDIDLLTATDLIFSARYDLKKSRNDNVFQNTVNNAKDFINASDREFEELKQMRPIKVPRKHDQNVICSDNAIVDPLFKMKVETFNVILDTTLSTLESRFNDEHIGILRDISLFSKKRIDEININVNKFPIDSFSVFCSTYTIISQEDLKTEYLQFVKIFKMLNNNIELPHELHQTHNFDEDDKLTSSSSDEEEELLPTKSKREMQNAGSINHVFKVFCTANMSTVFPNLYIALKITVTLPVSSASTERSFSRLKLLKTRLRTSTSQNRLENLLIISCENDIEVDKDEVVKKFAAKSKVLTKLLTM